MIACFLLSGHIFVHFFQHVKVRVSLWPRRMCSNGLNHVLYIVQYWPSGFFVTARFIIVRGLYCTNILYDVFIVILRRSSGQVWSHIVSLIYNNNKIFDWIIVLYLVCLYFVLFLQICVQSSTFEMFLVVTEGKFNDTTTLITEIWTAWGFVLKFWNLSCI